MARYLTMQHKSMRKLRLVWGRLDLIRRSMLEFGFKRSTIFTAEVRSALQSASQLPQLANANRTCRLQCQWLSRLWMFLTKKYGS